MRKGLLALLGGLCIAAGIGCAAVGAVLLTHGGITAIHGR